MGRPVGAGTPTARSTVRLVGVGALAFGLQLMAWGADVARADLKLCNSTSSRIGIAIGYKDPRGWTTEGWWNVASHTCETLLKGNLIARYYYLHAIDYDRGGEWRGPAILCTDDKAFTIEGVENCAERGFNSTGFFEVDTGEEKSWTVRLTDPAEAETKTQ